MVDVIIVIVIITREINNILVILIEVGFPLGVLLFLDIRRVVIITLTRVGFLLRRLRTGPRVCYNLRPTNIDLKNAREFAESPSASSMPPLSQAELNISAEHFKLYISVKIEYSHTLRNVFKGPSKR